MKIISLLFLPILCFAKFSIQDGMIQPFELDNLEIKTFISDYAEIVKKPLLVGRDSLKGKVTFSTFNPISLEDFSKMFVTVLGTQGLTLVEEDSFLRVIQERDVRYVPNQFYSDNTYPKNDQFILYRHELKNPLSNEISRNMRPFLSRYGRVMSYNDGHTIILAEKANNLTRLLSIIDKMDRDFDLDKFIGQKLKRNKERSSKKIDPEIEKIVEKIINNNNSKSIKGKK